MEVDPVELSILLADDQAIRELNRTWRNKNRPTDVLAFPQREGPEADPNDPVLGDIVISLETAEAQAKQHHHSLEAELELLLAHGILHLLGYDHERNPKEAARMRKKEQELLDRLKK